jgi:hypothetical protein
MDTRPCPPPVALSTVKDAARALDVASSNVHRGGAIAAFVHSWCMIGVQGTNRSGGNVGDCFRINNALHVGA